MANNMDVLFSIIKNAASFAAFTIFMILTGDAGLATVLYV